MCDKALVRVIFIPHKSSLDQLTGIFTKSIISELYDYVGSKMCIFDLYNLLKNLVNWI